MRKSSYDFWWLLCVRGPVSQTLPLWPHSAFTTILRTPYSVTTMQAENWGLKCSVWACSGSGKYKRHWFKRGALNSCANCPPLSFLPSFLLPPSCFPGHPPGKKTKGRRKGENKKKNKKNCNQKMSMEKREGRKEIRKSSLWIQMASIWANHSR